MHNNSEKGNPSAADVILAIATFLEEAAFQDEIRLLPLTVQQMFEDILDTELGSDLDYRRRILATLNIARQFSACMEPFSNQQIVTACQNFNGHE